MLIRDSWTGQFIMLDLDDPTIWGIGIKGLYIRSNFVWWWQWWQWRWWHSGSNWCYGSLGQVMTVTFGKTCTMHNDLTRCWKSLWSWPATRWTWSPADGWLGSICQWWWRIWSITRFHYVDWSFGENSYPGDMHAESLWESKWEGSGFISDFRFCLCFCMSYGWVRVSDDHFSLTRPGTTHSTHLNFWLSHSHWLTYNTISANLNLNLNLHATPFICIWNCCSSGQEEDSWS